MLLDFKIVVGMNVCVCMCVEKCMKTSTGHFVHKGYHSCGGVNMSALEVAQDAHVFGSLNRYRMCCSQKGRALTTLSSS